MTEKHAISLVAELKDGVGERAARERREASERRLVRDRSSRSRGVER